MVRARAVFVGGVALLLLLAGASAAEDMVPLSRVLLTETDLRSSIAKVALARYYLGRTAQGSSQADGDWQEATERAAKSLGAAVFYVDSSLILSRGELRRDLEKLRGELRRVESRMRREPSKALGDLEGLERRLGEVLGGIERASRTYKGTQGWIPSWTGREGQSLSGTAVPSQ